MKFIYITYVLFVLLAVSFGSVLLSGESSQELLVGKWQEVSWEYEKVDKHNGAEFELNEAQINEICNQLVIHQSEIWEFAPSNKLHLHNKESGFSEVLDWNVKGRGHILELKHQDSRLEGYQVQEISEDNLVIHFNFDLRVRGIVKLTFKKISEQQYAQKI
ncbi:hypothetical protein V6R21_09865 [Limibacter armeniacum]|uniref:hypothetical protein n=1 Tax=Limibacter armeniacum TaxID=466084 RepID=UPI002FE5E228